MGLLLRTCLLQIPYSTKEDQAQTPRPESPQSCTIGKSNIHSTKPNIPTLRRDNVLAKAHIKSVTTSTRNEGKESRTFIELNIYVDIYF
jgi:hypothetical protein